VTALPPGDAERALVLKPADVAGVSPPSGRKRPRVVLLRQRLDVVPEFDGAVSTTTITKVLYNFYRGLVVEGHVDAETYSRDDSPGIALRSTPKIGAGEGTRV
jgi:hypothetical protein